MTETWDERIKHGLRVLFGDTNEKRVKALQHYVVAANAFEPQMQALNDSGIGDSVLQEVSVAVAPRQIVGELTETFGFGSTVTTEVAVEVPQVFVPVIV